MRIDSLFRWPGELQVVGLTEELLTDPAAAVAAIHRGQAARVTSPNAVHADSSRSHAVLQVSLPHLPPPPPRALALQPMQCFRCPDK